MEQARHSTLGKPTEYSERHDPDLLFPIDRAQGRQALGWAAQPDFAGNDTWHAWELSWLDQRGRPQAAVARFVFDCHTPRLIESKSFKLYLNSLAQTRVADRGVLTSLLTAELVEAAGGAVDVMLFDADDAALAVRPLSGDSIDQQDVDIDHYGPPDAGLLMADADSVARETLVSRVFRSNCPVTGQPDWASVQIRYAGPRIDRASLLRYLVSFRRHSGFHEQCVEQIFSDIRSHCGADRLDVRACFTRRGGLDINPWRSTHAPRPDTVVREARQ